MKKYIYSVRLTGLGHLRLDKKSRILEDTYTLIGLPPYLAGQRSSTSPKGGFLKRGYYNRAFFCLQEPDHRQKKHRNLVSYRRLL